MSSLGTPTSFFIRLSISLLDPSVSPDKASTPPLDACAAPGGKAIHMAGLMENSGRLVCCDSNEKRLPRLRENLERCGVSNAEVHQHDWSKPAPDEWLGFFDAILLDVPCSNTGVLRRRVDARWRLQKADLLDLVKLQREILEVAATCVKPGGRLVYSTCSIDPEENLEQVQRFAEDDPDFSLGETKQILPFVDDTDGAFTAMLIRNAVS